MTIAILSSKGESDPVFVLQEELACLDLGMALLAEEDPVPDDSSNVNDELLQQKRTVAQDRGHLRHWHLLAEGLSEHCHTRSPYFVHILVE